jgi:hypothetical protein
VRMSSCLVRQMVCSLSMVIEANCVISGLLSCSAQGDVVARSSVVHLESWLRFHSEI